MKHILPLNLVLIAAVVVIVSTLGRFAYITFHHKPHVPKVEMHQDGNTITYSIDRLDAGQSVALPPITVQFPKEDDGAIWESVTNIMNGHYRIERGAFVADLTVTNRPFPTNFFDITNEVDLREWFTNNFPELKK